MKEILRCLFLLIGIQIAQAQDNLQAIYAHFVSSSLVWSLTLPHTKEALPIHWQERKGNFNSKGYRSFVGYYGETFVGTFPLVNKRSLGKFFMEENPMY